MGKPLMLQEADAERIESLKKRLRARTKIEVVRSALDLLSAAYAVDPAFAEAEIVRQGAGARPAFPDNRPRIITGKGYIYVNGLYRHGFLLAPALAELVAIYLATGETHPEVFVADPAQR